MWLLRQYTVITLLLAGLGGQSLMNGFGAGFTRTTGDATALGISSSGLLPAYQTDVSLNNPSTWQDLRFTLLSGMYGGRRYELRDLNIKNEMSDLNLVRLIVPIKKKYSIGFGLYPFIDRQIKLRQEIPDFVIDRDTLALEKQFIGTGGVNVFDASVGIMITEYETIALNLSYLFGSARQANILTIDDVDYRFNQRHVYTGTLANLYLRSKRFSFKARPTSLFLKFGMPIKSLTISSYSYQPFEDNNGSGYHDREVTSFLTDFPDPTGTPGPVKSRYQDQYNPYEIGMGTDLEFRPRMHILAEFNFRKDNAEIAKLPALLNDQVQIRNQVNIGFVKFPAKVTRNFLDHGIFRFGLYYKSYQMKNSAQPINENGLSLGFGFKFGITNNQIDIGYLLGRRQGFGNIGDESVQQYTVGISIGDIWFVKRRER